MDAGDLKDDATQPCSIGGPRCNSVCSAAKNDDDDDYGIPPWEHDPVGGGESGEAEKALSEGWRRKAYRELQEKPEWRRRDIEELRNMVRGTEVDFKFTQSSRITSPIQFPLPRRERAPMPRGRRVFATISKGPEI